MWGSGGIIPCKSVRSAWLCDTPDLKRQTQRQDRSRCPKSAKMQSLTNSRIAILRQHFTECQADHSVLQDAVRASTECPSTGHDRLRSPIFVVRRSAQLQPSLVQLTSLPCLHGLPEM